jgi:hypothetical protein
VRACKASCVSVAASAISARLPSRSTRATPGKGRAVSGDAPIARLRGEASRSSSMAIGWPPRPETRHVGAASRSIQQGANRLNLGNGAVSVQRLAARPGGAHQVADPGVLGGSGAHRSDSECSMLQYLRS